MMSVLIDSLSGVIGQNIDDVGDVIEANVAASGFVYRWLEPDTVVDAKEVRLDRLNVNVDSDHIILSLTVG